MSKSYTLSQLNVLISKIILLLVVILFVLPVCHVSLNCQLRENRNLVYLVQIEFPVPRTVLGHAVDVYILKMYNGNTLYFFIVYYMMVLFPKHFMSILLFNSTPGDGYYDNFQLSEEDN